MNPSCSNCGHELEIAPAGDPAVEHYHPPYYICPNGCHLTPEESRLIPEEPEYDQYDS